MAGGFRVSLSRSGLGLGMGASILAMDAMSCAYLEGTEKTDKKPTDWLSEEVVRCGV